MWHEHQRQDRYRHLMVHEGNVGVCQSPFDLRPEAKVDRPYDYASTMHYGRGPFSDLPWLDTIPPGVSILSAIKPAPISSGDIDYVARSYGQPPTATTISTNPPGLDVILDGVRHTAPVTVDWVPGSTHDIEAPLLQTGDNGGEPTRFVFGSWTDSGGRAHTITSAPDTTWYQANYIVQLPVVTEVQQPDAGRMSVRPESPDGFYTVGTPVEILAEANPGHNFLEWEGTWMPGSGVINWLPGNSWNPARVHVGLNLRAPQVHPRFGSSPVISIEVEGYDYGINTRNVEDRWGGTLPKIWPVDSFKRHFTDEEGNLQIGVQDGLATVEAVPSFLRWSDGVVGTRGENDVIIREIEVPAEGGELVTEWEPHVPMFDARVIAGRGHVEMIPPPLQGRKLSYWSGGASYYGSWYESRADGGAREP